MFYISDFLSYLRLSSVYGRWFLPLFSIEVYGESSLFSPKSGREPIQRHSMTQRSYDNVSSQVYEHFQIAFSDVVGFRCQKIKEIKPS